MAIRQGKTYSFVLEHCQGIHDLTGDALFVALYTKDANLDPATATVYTTDNESSGAGYTAGGQALAGAALTQDPGTGIVMLDFTDSEWPAASFETSGAMVYNSSKANRSVFLIDFGRAVVNTGGIFRISWPQVTVNSAIMTFH